MMRGKRINPFQIGLLAAAGVKSVPVFIKPRVAYVPTGNELVKAGTVPKRGQNIETNSLMTKALLQKWQADMVELPIVRDQKSELETCLDMALEKADIVLLNGGSSMGAEDFVSDMLARRGDYCQHGVRAIPGVPVAAAFVNGKPVINLPGPPYATFCALDWCVKPLVFGWFSQPTPARVQIKAALDEGFQKRPDFEMIMRLAVRKNEDGSYSAHPILNTVRYPDAAKSWNALLVAPIGIDGYEAGAIIGAELLDTDGF
jgi:molybdopterin molybdotransferase/putative molybdopterin biosynthesis protein